MSWRPRDLHEHTVGQHREEHPGLLRVPHVSFEYTKNIPKTYPNASKIYPRYTQNGNAFFFICVVYVCICWFMCVLLLVYYSVYIFFLIFLGPGLALGTSRLEPRAQAYSLHTSYTWYCKEHLSESHYVSNLLSMLWQFQPAFSIAKPFYVKLIEFKSNLFNID